MIDIIEAGGRTRSVTFEAIRGELEPARRSAAPSFAPERLALVAEVSSAILKSPLARASAGVTHFAYWTRRSALKSLANDALGRLPANCMARPRGLVLHLPPQNVETVFLYSWVISYLVGNANITRLPTGLGADMQGLLGLFLGALDRAGDRSQFFVRYPVSDRMNRDLSAVCDARLVWGGDAKVATFAALPLRDGGKSIWFGDRRSLAFVDGEAVSRLDEAGVAELAARFHNDIFVFDQLACSSPVKLFVVGDETRHGEAVSRFMAALSLEAMRRDSSPAAGHVIRKMVVSMAKAGAGGATRVVRYSNALTTLVASSPGNDEPPVGGGMLELVYVPDLAAIYPALGENSQTAVHFGFDQDALGAFATGLPSYALTRIVPIGQALDFDVVWDGYDLCLELTRLLRVR